METNNIKLENKSTSNTEDKDVDEFTPSVKEVKPKSNRKRFAIWSNTYLSGSSKINFIAYLQQCIS